VREAGALEQRREVGRVEVVQVRRGQAFLPHPLERPRQAGARQPFRQPIEEAPAVGQVQDQDAAGVQAGMAGGDGAADVRDVFDHVVEHDHVERFLGRQRIGEVARAHRQAPGRRLAADRRIGLDAQHVEVRRRRFEEPAVRAAHIQQPARSRGGVRAGQLHDLAEIFHPQHLQRRLARRLVDLRMSARFIDRHLQGGGFIAAAAALRMPGSQAWHYGTVTHDTFHADPNFVIEKINNHCAISLRPKTHYFSRCKNR
jgi:hypothetical protein